jgi:hypothetical protein
LIEWLVRTGMLVEALNGWDGLTDRCFTGIRVCSHLMARSPSIMNPEHVLRNG